MKLNNKFGMFIHWGIYSMLGLHEQCQSKYNIERNEYENLLSRFNPINYDPEKWVLLAKSAGMKYICFTAKHHDGFCMWDTKYTDYNIMNTPYKKDVLKMLADACHKHGLLLSIYYSNPDWHHPNAYNPLSTHQWSAKNKENVSDLLEYREYVKNQITELLTNYGEIYTLFWDIPPKVEDSSINELVRGLQPNIYINDRGWDRGDFSTPERDSGDKLYTRFARMTEACNSVGANAWGYREGEDFYSLRYLTSSIDRIMALGGNYLLNVGPDSLGNITEEYAERIRKVGDWYNRMQGCLECAEACDDFYESKCDAFIATKKNGKTYLHFYNGVLSTGVSFLKYPHLPKSVRLMNTGELLDFEEQILPFPIDEESGLSNTVQLHIHDVPVDRLSCEPIVFEICY